MKRLLIETESSFDVDGDPNRIRKYDPSNPEHYFMLLLAHSVTIENAMSGARIDLDHENLVSIVGPYCFYCQLRPGDSKLTEKCYGPYLEKI